jgi:hypothetical protein
MFRLPISGVDIGLRPPAGADELLLFETQAADPALAAMLMARVASCEEQIDWTGLAVTDMEAGLLKLRQLVIGNLLRTDVHCMADQCNARVDIAFRISDYLEHLKTRTPKYVERAEQEGWFRLRGTAVVFRIPTVADQIAVARLHRADSVLARLCIRPAETSGAIAKKAERALSAMSPCLSHSLRGVCPECHTDMEIYFDVYGFVLAEFRGRAAFVYQDVHLIAERYHWPESRILAMPCPRRRQYAEIILEGKAG